MKTAGVESFILSVCDRLKQTCTRNLAILIVVVAGLVASAYSLGLSFNLTNTIVHLLSQKWCVLSDRRL